MDYRSEIIMQARGGSADFEDVPTIAAGSFTDTYFSADLPLPAELTAGISYKASDKWLFAFEYNYTKWNVYKSLDVDFDNALPTSINPRNYKNIYLKKLKEFHRVMYLKVLLYFLNILNF